GADAPHRGPPDGEYPGAVRPGACPGVPALPPPVRADLQRDAGRTVKTPRPPISLHQRDGTRREVPTLGTPHHLSDPASPGRPLAAGARRRFLAPRGVQAPPRRRRPAPPPLAGRLPPRALRVPPGRCVCPPPLPLLACDGREPGPAPGPLPRAGRGRRPLLPPRGCRGSVAADRPVGKCGRRPRRGRGLGRGRRGGGPVRGAHLRARRDLRLRRRATV